MIYGMQMEILRKSSLPGAMMGASIMMGRTQNQEQVSAIDSLILYIPSYPEYHIFF
jgi:hypothetical protein